MVIQDIAAIPARMDFTETPQADLDITLLVFRANAI